MGFGFTTDCGRLARFSVAILALLLWTERSAQAANQTWNGNGANGNWSTTTDWVGGAAPGSTVNKTSADTATFNGTGNLANSTITIDSLTQDIGSITFDLAASPAYTIGSLGPNSGNTLFLTAGGTIQLTATVGAVIDTINAPLRLEGSYTFANNSTNAGSSLLIGGNVSLDSGAAASTLTLTGANGITVSGVISNGGNTLALTKTGADTLFLTGANTYTGINTLSAGIVNLGASETAGVSGPLGKSAAANAGNIVLGGGTLQYTTSNQFDYSGRFSTATGQKYNADINGQNVTWATALTSSTGALTLSSTAGGGTLILSGTNTFNGGVTINSGTLQLNNANALGNAINSVTFGANSTGTLTLNGNSITINDLTTNAAVGSPVIQNGAASGTAVLTVKTGATATDTYAGNLQDGSGGKLGLTKDLSTGALVLSGSNSFTGATTVNSGTLVYNSNTAASSGSAITIGPGGTVAVGGGFTTTPLTTLNGLITAGSTGTVALAFTNPVSESFAPTAPVFFGSTQNNFATFNGTVGAVGGQYRFGGGGSGRLTLNLSSPLSGANGVIIAGAPTANSVANAAFSTRNTAANNAGGTVVLMNENTYTGGTSVLGDNAVVTGAYNQAVLEVGVSSITSGGALVSGPIGSGTLTLSGGGLQDNSNNITLNNSVVINGNTSLTSNGNGTLTFTGNGLTSAPTFTIANSPTLTVNNIATTIADNITGTGFTKNGLGNLILSGSNSFSTGITVNGNLGFGNVQFNSPAAIGGATVTVNAGGGVAPGPTYNNLQTQFFPSILNTSAGVIALSASTADNFDWSSGGVNFTAASLGAAFGSNVTYSGAMTPNGTTYRFGGRGGTLTVAGPLTGANGVNLFSGNMAGTVVLGGQNTYSGNTTINGTQTASYFNVGNASQTNGNFASILRVASNSTVSGGVLQSGPIGTGTLVFAGGPSLSDNGTSITLANNVDVQTTPIAITSSGNGAIIFDGPTGTTFNIAGTNQAATGNFRTIQTDDTTIIKTPMTGTFGFVNGATATAPTLTFSGTGTLVLAAQSTYSFGGTFGVTNPIATPATSATANGSVLNSGNILRFAASSTTGVVGGNTVIVSGPLGGTNPTGGPAGLTVQGNGNTGTFIQDNGTNITIANPINLNLNGTPINFDSTGLGSITFDGNNLTAPTKMTIFAGTPVFVVDNTVTINMPIVDSSGSSAANRALNVGFTNQSNSNKMPYGTLILGSNLSTFGAYATAGVTTTAPVPLTTSLTLNSGTLQITKGSVNGVVGTSTFVTSGPVGVGLLALTGNTGAILDVEDPTANKNIVLENNVNQTGTQFFKSANGTSLTFDFTGLTTKATYNLTGGTTFFTYTNVIINDQITTNNGITKRGPSTLILGNTSGSASTYGGSNTQAGVLQINNANAFGSNGNATASFGGTVAAGPNYNGGASLQTTFFNKIVATSLGTVAITSSTNENLNFSNTTVGGVVGVNFITASFGAAAGTLASPVVYGNGSTVFTPSGTVYRFGGGGGVLQVNAPLSNSNSLIVGGGGSGATQYLNSNDIFMGPTSANNGTVILGTAYTGATNVDSGTLQLNVAPGSTAGLTGIYQVNTGAAISAGSSYGTPDTLLPLINGTSTGALALSSNSGANLDFTGFSTLSLGAENATSATYSGTLTPAGGTYRLGGGNGSLTVSSNLTGSINSLVVNGNVATGTVIPTGTNTFGGGATLAGGTLQLNSGTAVVGNAIQSGPVGTGTLTLAGGTLTENGGAVTLANPVSVFGSTTLSGDTGSFTFDGAGLTTPAKFTVNGNPLLTITNTTTINDVVAGTLGFTKLGGGTLVLNAANTYSGTTNFVAGTLKTGNAGALPSGTTLNLGVGATLDVNGQGLSFDQLTGSGVVSNSGANATLTLGASGGSNNFLGTIQNGSGTVAVAKLGAGTMTLSGQNTYSAGTTLIGGTLRLGSSSRLTNATGATSIASGPVGTGTLTLGTGTTLQDSGFTTGLANAVAISGAVTISSPSAAVAFPSPNSGSLRIDGVAAGNAVTLTGNTTLTVNNTTTIADSIGQLGGLWSLTMDGSGTLVLGGSSNTYSGGTTVNSGVLQLNTPVNSGILVGNAGTLAAGPGFGAGNPSTPIGTMLSSLGITTNSTGTIALTGNDSENIDFSAYPTLSLGATGSATYSGTLTPNGTTYMLGGGGGTLTVTGALSSSNSLIVGGNTAGGGSGGTVILANALNSATSVNSGVLQLSTVGTGNITVNNGGAVAMASTYAPTSATPITSSLLPLINTSSAGTLALTASTSENLNLSSYSSLSLGAAAGAGVAYNGTLTPGASGYHLGGGGGTITVTGNLAGSTNALTVGGNGSGGTVILSGTNTYGDTTHGTTITKGSLAVGPNSSALGSGPVRLNGGTLTLLPQIAPLAATGYNTDVIWGAGEASPQAGATGFGDGVNALNQKGTPGSLAVGGTGLPASRSFVSYNPNAVFQLQPYNAKNDLQLTPGGTANDANNRQDLGTTGTLTLANPGQYSTVSILNGTSNGNNWFQATLNFSDGSTDLRQGLFAGDWFTPSNFNSAVNGTTLTGANGYTIAYIGAGWVSTGNNAGTYLNNGAQNVSNGLSLPRTTLYETDVALTPAEQGKTLTSVTITNTSGFTGTNNADARPNGNMNIMGISGALVNSVSGPTTYSNNLSVAAGTNSTIDLQNPAGVTFMGSLAMGDASTLNVINSLGAFNPGLTPSTLAITGAVTLPASGSHTTTFNVASPAQNPISFSIGSLDDGNGGSPGPAAIINMTGANGTVNLAGFASSLVSPQVNVTSGATLALVGGEPLGATAKVNIDASSTFALSTNTTVSSLSGTGTVQLALGTNAGTLTIGGSDNLSVNVANTFVGAGTVQNGGSNNSLTLSAGNFHANTQVNSNGSSTIPSVVAGNTYALGNTVTLGGGILRLQATPGSATMTGFGGNFGIANQNLFGTSGIVSNGWQINSTGFQTTGANLTNFNFNQNGNNATPYNVFPSANVLQLTDGSSNEARTAFYSTQVPVVNGSAGFTASFTYQIRQDNQADGMAFVLQNDPRGAGVIGAGGGTLGFAGNQGTLGSAGIQNSMAFVMDIFNNAGAGGVGVGLALNGPGSQANGVTPFDTPVKFLDNGDPINVTLNYSPSAKTLTATLIDSLIPANTFTKTFTGVDLSATLGGNNAYVGFTAGTGGQNANQLISNFAYSLAGGTPGSYAANVSMNGGSSTIDLAASAATPTFSVPAFGSATTPASGNLTVSATTAPAGLNYGLTFTGASTISSTLALNVFHAGPLNGGGTDGTGTGLGSVTFAGSVSGAGGITNNGPGNVVLAAPNFYTGGTAVNTGPAGPGNVVVSSVAGLGSGTVTLNGGVLKLQTPLPAGNQAPVALTGWNTDVVIAANQTPATIAPSLSSFDGGGVTHPAGSALFETGTSGSPSGGLPSAPSPGAPASFTSAINPNVVFQFQPYSTASGGLVNNNLQLNNFGGSSTASSQTTGTLTLTNPGKFASLNILDGTGNGPGIVNMTLNFADANPLTVTGVVSPDWFSNVTTPALVVNGRYNGGFGAATNVGLPNPVLHEFDYTLPAAYQTATLQSITFNYLSGGEINFMAVSGQAATTVVPVNVAADSTIDVTGTATSGLTGLTTIGSNTLHVTGGSTGTNAAYTLSLGTNGGVTLNGNPIFNVAKNGSGVGTLVLGALNDQGAARTLEFSGSGATTAAVAASSLVAGTLINIDAGATMNSNAAGTGSSGGSLGQFAQVSVAGGGTFGVGATQTIGSLAGSGNVVVAGGATLTVGNSTNLASVFNGTIGDAGAGSPGSINVGVVGSSGSLTLTASNTYHGGTTVTGGTLFLQTATTNNIPNSSTITVLSNSILNVTGVTGSGGFTVPNGQTLQGATATGGAGGGTVNGMVTISGGSLANSGIAGYSTTTTPSLTIGVAGAGPALTLQSGSNSNFTLQGNLGNSTVELIGTNSGSGQSLAITGTDTVNITDASLLPTAKSTYRLFGYTGTQLTGGQFSNFTLGHEAQGATLLYSYSLLNQPGHVDLIVTPQGLTWAGVDDPAGAGAPVDAAWNTTSNNWVNSSGASASFSTGNQVIFGDSYLLNSGSVAVTSPQTVMVQGTGVSTTGVTFGANSVVYTVQNASGTIGMMGTGGIVVEGSSAAPVTLDSANSFSGAVLVATGQLNLGDGISANNGNALGQSSGVAVSAGATLNLNSVTGTSVAFGNGWNGAAGTAGTIPLAISGTGSGAPGVLGVLNSQSGNNTYAGAIAIGLGGATIASTSIGAGDGLFLAGAISNGSVTPSVLTFAGAGNTTAGGNITDSGLSNALSIALVGPGDLTLSGTNSSYHGSTVANGGLLILTAAKALGNSSGLTVPATAGLVLNNSGTTGLTATGSLGIPLSASGVGTGGTIAGTAFTSTGVLTDIGASSYGGPISLPGDATIATTSGTDALTLSGSVEIATAGTPQTLTFIGPGTTTVSGAISDGGAAAAGSIIVNGVGDRVVFSVPNTYFGSTTVNSDNSGGALILQAATALGNTPGVTVNAGGGLVLVNNLTFGLKALTGTPISLTLAGSGTGVGGAANGANGALTGVGTNNTYSGPITISSPGATITTSAATDVLTLTRAINSTGATLTLNGPGTINVNGGLNINTGALRVSGSGTASIGGGLPITDGATGGTVTMLGTGTLNLTGTGVNTYTGGTIVTSGTTVVGGSFQPLGTGLVTLNGGKLQLAVGGTKGLPVAATGYNRDVVAAANQTAAIYGSLISFDGTGASHAPGNILYETNFVGSPGGSGLPSSGTGPGLGASYVAGAPASFTSAVNPSVVFQFQPYSTAAGATSGNSIQLNNSATGASATLTVPANQYANLNILNGTGNGPGSFTMTLNFSDSTTFTTPTITSIDWFPPAGTTNIAIGPLGRWSGGTNFNGLAQNNPDLLENDFTLPAAQQAKTLTSIKFNYVTGGEVNIMAISASTFTTSPVYTNDVSIEANSAIDVTGSSAPALSPISANAVAFGDSNSGSGPLQLTVTGGSTGANAPYTLYLGTTASGGGNGVVMGGTNSRYIIDVANNGTGTGTLVLGPFGDGGSPRTFVLQNTGTLLLNQVGNFGSGSAINVGPTSGGPNGGNLVVSNAVGSPTGTAAVNVNNGGRLSGAFASSGTGSIAGLVTVNGGGTILGSNVAALAGTPLTLTGGLTFAGASNSSFALSTTANGTTNPMINVASALTVTGADTVKLTGGVPTTLASYTYDLFAYTGTVTTSTNGSGTVLTFTSNGGGTMSLDAVANLPSNAVYAYKLVNNTAGSQIDLVLTPTPLTWTGATNGNWDTATTNWASFTNTATTFVNGAAVQFLNKNPITNVTVTNTTVTITPATGVQPGNVSFGNTGPGNGGVNYTIQNAAGNSVGIGGTTPVTINGAGGQVTFAGANSFSGPLAITAGQLNLSDAEAIAGVNYSLGLGNASSVTVASGGTLQLTGATGATRTFGQGYNGGGLVAGSLTTPLALSLSGTGQAIGALNSTTGNNTYVGPISIGAAGATIGVSSIAAGDALNLSGAVGDGGAGNPGSITKVGAGTLNLATANTYFGGTTVNAGTLLLSNASALGNSFGATVNSGGALALTGGTTVSPLTFGNLASSSGTIPLVLDGPGTGGGTFANAGALANSGVNTYAGSIGVPISASIGTTAASDVLTLGGAISGNGVVTLLGPGTIKLAVVNSYAGGTIVNATGTVIAPSTGALGSGTLTLNNGVVRVAPGGGPTVSGFGGGGTGWTQNGTNAGTFINSDVAEMSINPGGSTRSAWFNTPVTYQTAGGNVGFTASFTYQFQGGTNPPADGITFTLQNSGAGVTALGGGGGSFGYAGITPSAAIQLNIYTGANGGQGIAFNTNGGIGNSTAFGAPSTNNISTSPVVLASTTGTPAGDPINVTVAYNPVAQTIVETLSDPTAGTTFNRTFTGVNLASVLGNNGNAIVGFTGATGGSLATQDISNFQYTNGIPAAYPNTTLGGADTSTIDVAGAAAGGAAVPFGTLTVGSGGAATLNLTDATDAAGPSYGATFGATTLNSNVTFNVANAALGANGIGTLTLGAITGGTNSLTKTGPGTLIVTGASSYTGGTLVSNGTLTTTSTGTIGNGALTINAATGVTSTVNLGSTQNVTSLASAVAGTGTATLNVASGATLTDTQSTNTTFQGKVALASTATLAKAGAGSLEINGAPALGDSSALQVSGGTLKFNVAAGGPATVGAGVTATVTGTATLELANTVSALSDGTAAHSANIVNNSTAAAGLLVSGSNSVQKVGGIDGTGTTQVNAGNSLTANHIIQGALIIGGTSTSVGLVTIDASDASGNPLAAAGGLALAGSVASNDPLAAGSLGSSNLLAAGGASSAGGSNLGGSIGSTSVGGTAAVPEPSTMVLAALGAMACIAALRRRNNSAKV